MLAVQKYLQIDNFLANPEQIARSPDVNLDGLLQGLIEADIGRRVEHNLCVLDDVVDRFFGQAHARVLQVRIQDFDPIHEGGVVFLQVHENHTAEQLVASLLYGFALLGPR